MFENLSDSQRKSALLFVFLSAIFLTHAMVAEFIGVKIFSVAQLLFSEETQAWLVSHLGLDFNMSVGVLIWPFVFVFSDILNEYFGRKGVRFVSFLTAGLLAYGFFVVWLGTLLPPAGFWLQLNSADPSGNPFDINYAYRAIFLQGVGITIGSLTAFLISQLIDVSTFIYIRRLTGHRWLWLRATGSTVISQLIDTFVILTIAFYLFGNWSLDQVIRVAIVQYFYKIVLAIALTPLLYVIHYLVDAWLGKEESARLIAMHESRGE
ncbi:MAG: queuosine precursor transporter [Bacteroidales bacterium]